jgi:chromosome segregation ATPase
MSYFNENTTTLDKLKKENKELRERIEHLEKCKKDANTRIDAFVETWYEENKDLVDIGEIQICGSYKVDLIPDELEKRIYSKMLKIVYSFLARDMI